MNFSALEALSLRCQLCFSLGIVLHPLALHKYLHRLRMRALVQIINEHILVQVMALGCFTSAGHLLIALATLARTPFSFAMMVTGNRHVLMLKSTALDLVRCCTIWGSVR